ncbi:hypothetical protein U1Q18_007764, partial [Sarracenia purpurea var. burkii]
MQPNEVLVETLNEEKEYVENEASEEEVEDIDWKGKGVRRNPLSDLPSSSTTPCDSVGVSQQTKVDNKFACLHVHPNTIDVQPKQLRPVTREVAPPASEPEHLQPVIGDVSLSNYTSEPEHPQLAAGLETLSVDNASDDDQHTLSPSLARRPLSQSR